MVVAWATPRATREDVVGTNPIGLPRVPRRTVAPRSWVLAGMLLTLTASGQDDFGIPYGPLVVYPAAEIAVRHDDNLFRARANEKSVWAIVLSPSVKVALDQGAAQYALSYGAEVGRYASSSADNYVYHLLDAEAGFELDARNRVAVEAGLAAKSDPRGTGRSEGVAGNADPDEYREVSAGVTYDLGASDTPAHLQVMSGHLNKRYTNNRASTFTRDRSNTDFGALASYRIWPNTVLLAEIDRTFINYRSVAPAAPRLDSQETRYRIGATWDATFQTQGTLKFGLLTKRFNDPTRNDFNGATWELGASWRPLSYSRVDVSVDRTTEETNGTGDFIRSDGFNATWSHAWLKRLSSHVSLGYSDDDFGSSARQDTVFDLGAGVEYQFRRWLTLGAEYTRADKDSNVNTFDYQQNVFMLTAKARL